MKIRNAKEIKSRILLAAKQVIADTKDAKGDDYFTSKKGFVWNKVYTVFNKSCKLAFGGLTFDEVCRAKAVYDEDEKDLVVKTDKNDFTSIKFIFKTGDFTFRNDGYIEASCENYDLWESICDKIREMV